MYRQPMSDPIGWLPRDPEPVFVTFDQVLAETIAERIGVHGDDDGNGGPGIYGILEAGAVDAMVARCNGHSAKHDTYFVSRDVLIDVAILCESLAGWGCDDEEACADPVNGPCSSCDMRILGEHVRTALENADDPALGSEPHSETTIDWNVDPDLHDELVAAAQTRATTRRKRAHNAFTEDMARAQCRQDQVQAREVRYRTLRAIENLLSRECADAHRAALVPASLRGPATDSKSSPIRTRT